MPEYVHGFSSGEQERLLFQAQFLAPVVFDGVDFSRHARVLELGCGVGAQTRILLDRFSNLRVVGVDFVRAQIERAKKNLDGARRIDLAVADARALPFKPGVFDGAFVCWFLEHVSRPVQILAEVRRTLRPGGVLHAIEVQNSTLYLYPRQPATERFWRALNEVQCEIGGDPYVGVRMGDYLQRAGFNNVVVKPFSLFFDNRVPGRREAMADYWLNLMLSSAPTLLDRQRVDGALLEEMKAEFVRFKKNPDGVFFYAPVKARAEV